MSKEKLASLTKYVADLKSKRSDSVPPKHKDRAKQYHAFLDAEIKRTQAQLEDAKIAGVK